MRIYNCFKGLSSRMSRMLEASEHVQVYPANGNKYGVGVKADVNYYVRQGILDSIVAKYADKISKTVRNIGKK